MVHPAFPLALGLYKSSLVKSFKVASPLRRTLLDKSASMFGIDPPLVEEGIQYHQFVQRKRGSLPILIVDKGCKFQGGRTPVEDNPHTM